MCVADKLSCRKISKRAQANIRDECKEMDTLLNRPDVLKKTDS